MPSLDQTHKPKRGGLDTRKPDDRLSAASRGYGETWRRLRLMVLRAEPMCRSCGQAAEVVDHIKPLSRGGQNIFANLQPLCKRCHDRKTATADGGFGR